MSKKQKFYFWTAVGGLLVVLVPLALAIFQNPDRAEAWYNEDWLYRIPLTITHNAEVTYNKVKFDIDTATLITAGKMQSDCGDSRFTDQSGKLLKYYLDSSGGACNTNSTDYYVLIPKVLNGTTVIYHYYGNPSAPNGTQPAQLSESTLAPSGSYAAGSEAQGKGPVAYWKFDEGGGQATQDATTNNNDGTLGADSGSSTDDPTWITEDLCLAGKCLKFDGGDYVNGGNGSSITFGTTTDFSVGFWMKFSAAQVGIIPLGKGNENGTSKGWRYKLDNSTGTKIGFRVSDGAGSSGDDINIAINDNKWHYVITTVDRDGNMIQYLDGKSYITTNISAYSEEDDTSILAIGRNGDSADGYFTGSIDEVKVYNYARTAAQIKQDYLSGAKNAGTKQGNIATLGSKTQDYLSNGLVGYWKMDEASWTVDCSTASVTDSSGNGNNGKACPNVSGPDGGDPAVYGKAGSLDNTDDYISVTNTISGVKTVAFWINPTANTSSIVDLNGTASISASSGTISATNFTSPSIYVNGVTSTTLTAGIWQYVVVTTDTAISASALNFGKIDSSYLNGSLDEVRMYNRSLSPKEVRDLYTFAPPVFGYWDLEEGTGTSAKDKSGNGNTGTWNGTGTNKWGIGKYGNAGSFNGTDDYINIPDPGANSVYDLGYNGAAISLEAWVYPTLLDANYRHIAGKADGGNSVNYALRKNNSADGVLQFYYRNSANNAWHIWQSTSSVLSLNTWTHVSLVFAFGTGASIKLYANGVPVAGSWTTGTGNDTAIADNSAFQIGSAGGAQFFKGKIDDVRIYNYARNAKQVVADMNAGHPNVGSPVGSAVGHWKFDEGAVDNCRGGSNDACNAGSAGKNLDGAFGASTAAPTYSNAGKFGKALDIDGGNDTLTVTNTSSIDLNEGLASGFTATAWINADDAGDSGGNGQVFVKSAGTYLRVQNLSGSNLDLAASVDLSTDATVTISTAVTTGNWYHVAMVWEDDSDDEVSVYVNGIYKGASTDGVGGTSADTASLGIGGTGTSTFDGKIDEFKIYNYPLTADEIRTDYNRGQNMVLGALSDKSGNQPNSANNEYCIPGDTSTCTAPVGEWKFEEKQGTVVYSTGTGASNNGSWNGTGTKRWEVGKNGTSGKFNGSDDYVQVNAGNSLNFSSNITLSAWIKLANTTGSKTIMGRYYNPSQAAPYYIYVSGDEINATFAKNWSSNYIGETTTTANLEANKWYHIAATYTLGATDVKIYINGKEDTSGSSSRNGTVDALATTDIPTYIGILYFGGGPSWHFNGQIDQARIYNYAMSPAQVAWDYNKGKPVGHWKLDECQGTSAYDSSGNGQTGTWNGTGAGTQTAVGTCTGSANTAWKDGATGKRNASLDFDGTDDFIQVTRTTTLEPANAMSVSAWIKTSTASKVVLDKMEVTDQYDSYQFYINSSSQVRLTIGRTEVTSTTTVTDGNWHLLTGTYDGSNVRLYIDGKQAASTSKTGTIGYGNLHLYIGKNDGSSGLNFNGQIDDVRVYNYGLTATQIKMLMNEGAVRFGPLQGTP